MLTIQLSDTLVLGITFAHPTDFQLDESKFCTDGTKVRYTHCEIYTIHENGGLRPEVTLIADGLAKCAAGDNFQKKVGRKIALTRALQKTDLSKEQRMLVWMGYLTRNDAPLSELVVTH